jgi:hypothetical protein
VLLQSWLDGQREPRELEQHELSAEPQAREDHRERAAPEIGSARRPSPTGSLNSPRSCGSPRGSSHAPVRGDSGLRGSLFGRGRGQEGPSSKKQSQHTYFVV